MGREARCACRWGEREGLVTVLLESRELVVRGAIRARVAFGAIERVAADGDVLEIVVARKRIAFELGALRARRWADAIASPPSLTRKLGVTSATRLHITGAIDDDALSEALASAADIVASLEGADLALIRTDDLSVLEKWIDAATSAAPAPPVWIVYVKGRSAPLGEGAVRELMRHAGYIDTKVAAVSERLTALRFVKKR